MLPSQWIVVGSQILNLAVVTMGTVDLNYHTHMLSSPLTLVVMTVLSAVGIHQTVFPSAPKGTQVK